MVTALSLTALQVSKMAYTSFAEFYDVLTQNIDYEEIAEYYNRLNEKFGGLKGILLDLACGTGSLSVIFSRMGYDVIGTDISPEMLSVAVAKEHDGIEYLCQSMTELDMFGTIDGTVCSLDSINHLTDISQVQKTFEKVSLFSNKGALFMFDVNTPFKHEHILGDNTFVYDTDEVYCVWQNEYMGEGRTDIYLDFFAEDKESGMYDRFSDDFSETAYPAEKIKELLINSGFEICACYEYLTENEPTKESEKLTFVARKI